MNDKRVIHPGRGRRNELLSNVMSMDAQARHTPLPAQSARVSQASQPQQLRARSRNRKNSAPLAAHARHASQPNGRSADFGARGVITSPNLSIVARGVRVSASVALLAENAALRRQVATELMHRIEAGPRRASTTQPRATTRSQPSQPSTLSKRALRAHLRLLESLDDAVAQPDEMLSQFIMHPLAAGSEPLFDVADSSRGRLEAAATRQPLAIAGQAVGERTTAHSSVVTTLPAHGRNLTGLRHAAKNIGMLLSGQAVTWICTLLLTAAYARFLGASDFGELYLATTFTSLVGFPIEYSFNQQIVRDVARAPEAAHRYLTTGIALKGALWITLYALALLLSVLLGYSSEERWLIAICGIMLVSTAISTTLISIQTAYMQVGLAKFGTVIEKLFDAVVAILLLRVGAGVETVAIVLLLGSIAGMSWQIIRVARMIGIRWHWDMTVARSLIRSGLSFLAYGVIGVIYYRIDTVLLSVLTTAVAIGIYGAAYRLFDTLAFVPGVLVGAIMSPILAKYSVTDKDKLRSAVERSVTAMLLCSLPAAVGLAVTAPNIIFLVYHRSAYSQSALVLEALAPGLIALFLNSALTTVLVSTGQERKLPIIAAAALVFNVILNLTLIPRFAEIGSAWATTLTEALLLVVGVMLIDRALIPARLWTVAGKVAVAALVMGLVAHALATNGILLHALGAYSIFVIVPVAAAIYVTAIVILRTLPPEEMAQLTGAFARRAVRLRGRSSRRQWLPTPAPEQAMASVGSAPVEQTELRELEAVG